MWGQNIGKFNNLIFTIKMCNIFSKVRIIVVAILAKVILKLDWDTMNFSDRNVLLKKPSEFSGHKHIAKLNDLLLDPT